MSLRIADLLIHHEDVPASARDALRAAAGDEGEDRDTQLRSAARILYRETELECADVRELVGLDGLVADDSCDCG